MAVLVTGGAGYIGSHTCLALHDAGIEPVILDNFSNSKPAVLQQLEKITEKTFPCYTGSCADDDLLDQIFSEQSITAVLHFAALKAVSESVENPLLYYQNNITGTLSLLKAMQKYEVKRFVFSSSATVYGEPESSPIPESARYNPMQPYGRSKQMIEEILCDLHTSDPSWCAIVLRYFNPVGAHASGLIGEDPQGIPNNLTPFITQVAIGRRPELQIFGRDYPTDDGTCLRDYIHVQDLAEGHVCALNKCESTPGYHVFNLGTGQPFSVLDVVKAFETACGKPIPYRFTSRRAGDVPAYWADPRHAQDTLGWQATRSLEQMAADCWHWQSLYPQGL